MGATVGLRFGALIGAGHFGAATDAIVLSAVAVLFLMLGARAFSRIQI